MKREMVWALVVSACLTACGGSDESGDSSAGGAGSSSEAPTSSSGNGAGASGGSGGASVGSGGATVGTGGAPDPGSTDCSEFPATVTMGATYVMQNKGALLCFEDDGLLDQQCSLVTGVMPYACPSQGDLYVEFLECQKGAAQCVDGSWDLWFRPNSDMDFVSWTGGMPGLNDSLLGVPTGMPVTIEIATPAGQYTIVFVFDGAGKLTITSFEPS